MPAAGCDLLSPEGVWYRGTRRENKADYARAHYAKNKERLKEWRRDYHARRYTEDPEYKRKHLEACAYTRRKSKYGLGKASYMSMVDEQKGLCAICGEEWGLDMRVDHNHMTGQIRALLCAKCNSGLGMFGEEPERLEAAAAYIRHHAVGAEEMAT